MQIVSPESEITIKQVNTLRNLRIELLELQDILNAVRTGDVSLEKYQNLLEQTKKDISGLLAADLPVLDSIYRIKNIWEYMQQCPIWTKPPVPLDAQQLTHYLNLLDKYIKILVFNIAYLTIRERLKEWLGKARSGYYIPFHLIFEDEVPDFNDRKTLLRFWSYQPKSLPGGLIDADNGVIYRYSKKIRYQLLSFLIIIFALLLAGFIVVEVNYIQIAGWPFEPASMSKLLLGWVAVMAGLIVHIAVSTAKYSKEHNSLPPILSIGDIPFIIDAKLGYILIKIFFSLVALFGLVFAAGLANVSLLNSFLVGYSLDSVIELFGTSIEQQAANQVALLRQQLGVETKA